MEEHEVIERWWRTLDGGEQRALLRLRSCDPLPTGSAMALQRCGVVVHASAHDEQVPAQPDALADFLVGIRYMN